MRNRKSTQFDISPSIKNLRITKIFASRPDSNDRAQFLDASSQINFLGARVKKMVLFGLFVNNPLDYGEIGDKNLN